MTISKKAYAELTTRIVDVFNRQLNAPEFAEIALGVVNEYINTGKAPACDTPTEVIIAFSMLRPEIDKAAERSRRARERSALRRKSSVVVNKAPSKTRKAVKNASKSNNAHSNVGVVESVSAEKLTDFEALESDDTTMDLEALKAELQAAMAKTFPEIKKNRRERRAEERRRRRELRHKTIGIK